MNVKTRWATEVNVWFTALCFTFLPNFHAHQLIELQLRNINRRWAVTVNVCTNCQSFWRTSHISPSLILPPCTSGDHHLFEFQMMIHWMVGLKLVSPEDLTPYWLPTSLPGPYKPGEYTCSLNPLLTYHFVAPWDPYLHIMSLQVRFPDNLFTHQTELFANPGFPEPLITIQILLRIWRPLRYCRAQKLCVSKVGPS